ncbi:MAG: serine dehydratase subunit alpha family protein [Methylocystaceae bacterium]|nr:serine dehydratase subunit alpha family protein [Methylocystaceae bacterium]
MMRTETTSLTYLDILREELVPAMGCTEPIALAYAAAKARAVLGVLPSKVSVQVSGNIIKNAKSVVVPHTGGLKGMKAAVAAGLVCGDSKRRLEVLSQVHKDQYKEITAFLELDSITVEPLESDLTFDLILTLWAGAQKVKIRLSHFHTNIVYLEKNGHTLIEKNIQKASAGTSKDSRETLTISSIVNFAENLNVEDVKDVLERQVTYNSRIAGEGLKGAWGANIGSVLLKTWGNDVKIRAKAMAAAGSDARMGGCELPVVIVTGSGNQGMTTSLPVVEYAKELESSPDDLFRALVVANLVAVHLKSGIGWLSAFCGAVSAGAGAAAGIAWLHGGRTDVISHTIANTLGSVSGMVCDGAKPACASKIAASVEAGILGFHMAQQGHNLKGGDGLVNSSIETTIDNIARLGRIGMRETDKEILQMMLEGDQVEPASNSQVI